MVDGLPCLTNGGGSGQDGWYVTVFDDITYWSDVETPKAFSESLDAIDQHQRQEYAALADAKNRMLAATRSAEPLNPSEVAEDGGELRWFETSSPR